MGYTLYERSLYVKARATVLSTGWEHSSNSDSPPNYAVVQYEVNGISYQTRIQVLLRSLHQEGSRMTIYCDPRDPLNVQDPLKLPMALILFLLFSACTVVIFIKRRPI